jgi:hypothetical protein
MKIEILKDEFGNIIHSCAVGSFPLPGDHWIYKEPSEPSPLCSIGDEASHEMRIKIREALKYTIQVCTSRGKDMDFDPDAMWMTLDSTLFSR